MVCGMKHEALRSLSASAWSCCNKNRQPSTLLTISLRTMFYMLFKKLSSRILFLLATLALFVNSARFSMLTKASSPGAVRSADCSWRGIGFGIVPFSRSCLRSYLCRCFFDIPTTPVSTCCPSKQLWNWQRNFYLLLQPSQALCHQLSAGPAASIAKAGTRHLLLRES